MARPIKWRRIENIPTVTAFVPSDEVSSDLVANTLLFEELEAIRLKDLVGLEQEECAIRMEVSRPTFQRILLSAREKIADSLVNAKGIQIEGGTYTRNICDVMCTTCGKKWRESYENLKKIKSGEYLCPTCQSNTIVCIEDKTGRFCRGNCWRHGQNRR